MTLMDKIELSRVKLERIQDSSGYKLDQCQLSSLESAQSLGHQLLDNYDREVLIVIGLNCKLKITVINPAAMGNVNRLSISAREILKPLILSSATRAIIMHNHPSGDTTPSRMDITFTEKMRKCLAMLGIELLDHLIIGDDMYSLRREGDLQDEY